MVKRKKAVRHRPAKKKSSKKKTNEETTEVRESRGVNIPRLIMTEADVWIVGDRPLLVNNKLAAAHRMDNIYGGKGKAAKVKQEGPTPDQMYAEAFYEMASSPHPAPHPKGHYGVPVSGIKKCVCSAIRTTGITDNTTIGLISKSFYIKGNEGPYCRVLFDKLERDVRPVNIGSGQKSVPQLRHRPMFHGWKIKLNIVYNNKVLSEDQLFNLLMHAGQFIGICELRAEKKQGECGGFYPEGV